ncbi:metal-dependent hydrolase [Paenibacillus sp. CAA11]|uniref:metal-dependent hydrolase n=1 Tax=Paenibacillus sp. CAA11 TaxID=1532905 RepID=UPI000D339141|nr:metal-dependent hydrolase [Paenibacillus sp. CAA11]AWB45635.1 metal-dependent hydrolase [Paenibacillus sp. CAA11]
MKGSTHLTLGVAIGTAAAVYYPFSVQHAAIYIATSAVSALSADLDGPSLLSSRIGKVSKWLHRSLPVIGILLLVLLAYQYAAHGVIDPALGAATGITLLPGLILQEGTLRNLLVSLCGGGLIYAGLTYGMPWLAGLGLFAVCAPWLKHRGLTHTLWALILWWFIGRGLEEQVQVPSLGLIAGAGYLSHLIADTLTPSGVKWLYPIWKKPFRLPFF